MPSLVYLFDSASKVLLAFSSFICTVFTILSGTFPMSSLMISSTSASSQTCDEDSLVGLSEFESSLSCFEWNAIDGSTCSTSSTTAIDYETVPSATQMVRFHKKTICSTQQQLQQSSTMMQSGTMKGDDELADDITPEQVLAEYLGDPNHDPFQIGIRVDDEHSESEVLHQSEQQLRESGHKQVKEDKVDVSISASSSRSFSGEFASKACLGQFVRHRMLNKSINSVNDQPKESSPGADHSSPASSVSSFTRDLLDLRTKRQVYRRDRDKITVQLDEKMQVSTGEQQDDHKSASEHSNGPTSGTRHSRKIVHKVSAPMATPSGQNGTLPAFYPHTYGEQYNQWLNWHLLANQANPAYYYPGPYLAVNPYASPMPPIPPNSVRVPFTSPISTPDFTKPPFSHWMAPDTLANVHSATAPEQTSQQDNIQDLSAKPKVSICTERPSLLVRAQFGDAPIE